MFYHVKDLQFNARVSRPDPRFARILLEAFGGANGELTSALQYFVQAFSCHNPFPDKYDMLMDIATEELAHLEIVGATIQMLLGPVNGEMKDAAETMEIRKLMDGKSPLEIDLPAPLNVIKKGIIKAIKGTDIEKVLRDHNVLKDYM